MLSTMRPEFLLLVAIMAATAAAAAQVKLSAGSEEFESALDIIFN